VTTVRTWIVALLCLGASVALAQPAEPLAQPAAAVVPEVVPPRPTLPGMPRDPFRPFTLDLHREPRTQVTPLQRYEIGQLTVVGTVWAVSPPRAMVEDSVGMGYIVTLGTPIGPNGGVVTAIEPQRVIIEERVLDYYGKEQVNRTVLETPKDDVSETTARERR